MIWSEQTSRSVPRQREEGEEAVPHYLTLSHRLTGSKWPQRLLRRRACGLIPKPPTAYQARKNKCFGHLKAQVIFHTNF